MKNVRTENVLAPDELLTHVILPAPGDVKSGHYEVRYKASHDWPIAFATVLLTFNGATVQSARVVMGAVAPIPWRSPAAEQALAGKTITEETAAAAAEAALQDARPLEPERVQDRCREDRRQTRHPARRRHPDRLTPRRGADMLSLNSPKITVGVHCLKLRTKGMYHECRWWTPTRRHSTTRTTTTAYWCVTTQTGFGPDGEPVRADLCCGERGCCKF